MEAIAYTALTMAAAVGLLAFSLAAFIRAYHYLQTHCAVRLMRQRGRLLSRADFEQRVADSTGTVLFEYPTLGWRVLRVWWTPDDVLARAHSAGFSEHSPEPDGVATSQFETWCHDTYTDLQSGRAFLVPLYIFGAAFQRFSRSLRTRFPMMRSVFVRSASVHFTRVTESKGNA
jgi:hypothetical protein